MTESMRDKMGIWGIVLLFLVISICPFIFCSCSNVQFAQEKICKNKQAILYWISVACPDSSGRKYNQNYGYTKEQAVDSLKFLITK